MKKAFTLIEILVVIAILALLAAILFPVFARARENARRASCQSNLKQMSLGVFQYIQDYDDKFPLAIVTLSTNPGPYGWADAMQPYIKSLQIYQCPSEKTPYDPNPSIGSAVGATTGYTDYAYNAALSDGLGTFNSSGACFNGFGRSSASMSDLEQPTLTILLTDSGSANAFNSGVGSTTPGLANFDIAGRFDARRHLGGSNLAFTDGHVKWIRMNETGQYSPSVYSMCNTFATSGQNATFHFKDYQ